MLCANCWRNTEIDHEHRERIEKHVVIGRIAAPAAVDPVRLLHQLDKATEKQGRCRIYAPDLCVAAGLRERASVDRRRFDLLTAN